MYSYYSLCHDSDALFLKRSLTVTDANKLFKKAKFPHEKILPSKIVKLRLREYFQSALLDLNCDFLDGCYAFVCKGVSMDPDNAVLRERTFVWLPLGKAVHIFEGEPFAMENVPPHYSSLTARFHILTEIGEQTLLAYFREFQINRLHVKAVADYLKKDGAETEKYPPLYFQKVPFLK